MILNSSIDEIELEKFDKISDQWWNKNGKFKILHQINPLRLQFIKEKISSHFQIRPLCELAYAEGFEGDSERRTGAYSNVREDSSTESTYKSPAEVELSKKPIQDHQFTGLNILDVGCGGGIVTVPMYQLGANISGVDASSNNIAAARDYALAHHLSINYLHSTVEELAAGNLQYDVLLCLELVEHVANINHFTKNLAALLKPGGMLILSTLNRTIKSYLLGIVAAEYLLKWVPKHTHDHSKFVKPSELYHLLSDSQISLKELKGLTYSLCTDTWLLSDDIGVNYFAYAVKE